MIHIKYLTPSPALFLTMILAVIMLESSGIDALITANLLVGWAARTLCLIGLLKLRTNYKKYSSVSEEPYKVGRLLAKFVKIKLTKYFRCHCRQPLLRFPYLFT